MSWSQIWNVLVVFSKLFGVFFERFGRIFETFWCHFRTFWSQKSNYSALKPRNPTLDRALALECQSPIQKSRHQTFGVIFSSTFLLLIIVIFKTVLIFFRGLIFWKQFWFFRGLIFWKPFWFFPGAYIKVSDFGAAPLYIFMKRDICDICDIFSDIFLGWAIFFHVERYSRYFPSKVDTKRFAFSSLFSSTFPFCAHITRQVKVKNIILMEKCSFCGPTFKEIRVWTKQNSEISRSVSYMYFCIFNRFVVNGSKIMFQCTSDDRWDHSL